MPSICPQQEKGSDLKLSPARGSLSPGMENLSGPWRASSCFLLHIIIPLPPSPYPKRKKSPEAEHSSRYLAIKDGELICQPSKRPSTSLLPQIPNSIPVANQPSSHQQLPSRERRSPDVKHSLRQLVIRDGELVSPVKGFIVLAAAHQ